MKKCLVWVSLITLLMSLFGCSMPEISGVGSGEDEEIELSVSAAASLSESMKTLKPMFEGQNENITLSFNFGGSGELATQIRNGSPCDVFISAAQKQMNELEEMGLIIPETRMNFVTNALVLIEPLNGKVNSIEQLTESSVKEIAIGEPSTVPAGQYAEQALETLGIWKEVEEKAIFGKDVSQVLTYVEEGEVQAGIVYKTDAMSSTNVKIVTEFPAESYSPVVYPMATIASSAHPEAAELFEDFLMSDIAQGVMEEDGFSTAAFVAPTTPPQPHSDEDEEDTYLSRQP